jgi:signal transduction histidine kinase/CheY-like chemotaxis protein
MNKRIKSDLLFIANEEKAKAEAELIIADEEKAKRQAELVIADGEKAKRQAELVIADKEKAKRADELVTANKELAYQNIEKVKRSNELKIANKRKAKLSAELIIADEEKAKRQAELIIADEEKAKREAELVDANKDKEKRAIELVIANKELAYQNQEKQKRADELIIANKELSFQNEEKAKRVEELIIANKEKEKRAIELAIANKELAFQNKEKEKRAIELAIANKELAFQNKEKEKRAKELAIANEELAFQNKEKEKRTIELAIANKELAFQNKEKEKRTIELAVANKELAFQNKEKGKRADELEIKVEERTKQLTETNKKLEEAKSDAEYANRAKSEFLANMSHEIRTPMNAVLGYADLLSSVLEDKTEKEYIESIKSSGRGLMTLINDILDLAKIEAGKLELQYEFVNSDSFFSEFERVFSFRVAEKGLKLIQEISSVLPAAIYIDEARLRQILFNLIGNAIKFTEHGEIKLKVYAENAQIVNHPRGRSEEFIDLIIEIEDTGIGISPEFQKEIFEPFTQAQGKKQYGGTGLGLSITRRLVGLMNGAISLQSELNRGSTFIVKIPKVVYLRNFGKKMTEIQINPKDIVFEKATIIVADDVEQNRRYLIDVLKNTNITIVEAEDGLKAYDLAKQIMPDLIIADIRMPNLDGFGLLNKLKDDEKLKHIPVVAYSASVMKDQKEHIHISKFSGLLIKPVQVAGLFIELMKHLPYESVKVPEREQLLAENNIIEDITDLPGLIFNLENGFNDTWKTFATRQPLGEIKEFGKGLTEVGKKNRALAVTVYGEELMRAAESFNIELMLKLIKEYPDIIKELKNSKKQVIESQ